MNAPSTSRKLTSGRSYIPVGSEKKAKKESGKGEKVSERGGEVGSTLWWRGGGKSKFKQSGTDSFAVMGLLKNNG